MHNVVKVTLANKDNQIGIIRESIIFISFITLQIYLTFKVKMHSLDSLNLMFLSLGNDLHVAFLGNCFLFSIPGFHILAEVIKH